MSVDPFLPSPTPAAMATCGGVGGNEAAKGMHEGGRGSVSGGDPPGPSPTESPGRPKIRLKNLDQFLQKDYVFGHHYIAIIYIELFAKNSWEMQKHAENLRKLCG